jgi:hypothetical protein
MMVSRINDIDQQDLQVSHIAASGGPSHVICIHGIFLQLITNHEFA